jgi:uncharacterized protein (TIGR02118 family)
VLKVVYPCRRLPELDRAEYARRILEEHVPLAIAHHPGMRHYVVNVVEREPEGTPPVDSFAELWFDSLESYGRDLYDSDEGRRIIGEDVARFLGGAEAYGTREHVHRAGPERPLGARTPGVKWLLGVRRKPELSPEAFLEHWHTKHVPLVLDALPALQRYVTSVVEARISEGATLWDGFSELWWESREAARAGLRAAGAAIDADTARFIAEARTWVVAEYPQK